VLSPAISNSLKPVLILGSGFHRHVFGDIGEDNRRTLYDWHHLVGQVAARMQVAVPDQVMSPVQRWEMLLLFAAKEGYRDHKGQWRRPLELQANFIEKDARRIVAAVLNDVSQDYPKSLRAHIPALACWGSVISLNFDMAWLLNVERFEHAASVTNISSDKLDQRELRRFNTRVLISGVGGGLHRSVWFPNGSCFAPETIRMGLHDYGAAPYAIQVAFSSIKRWERDVGVTGKSPEVQFDMCCNALRHASEGVSDFSGLMGEKPMPLTWVAEFLYRPLIFAGVGMSDQEAGFWWLLAQRARNLARTSTLSNAFILVDVKDRPAFWRTKPFRLAPIICSSWTEGWEKVLIKASELA